MARLLRPEPRRLQLPYAFRELKEPARHKAYYGGRGGAKSHSFAEVLVLNGYERVASDGTDFRWLCAREIQKSIASSVKQLLEDKIKAAGLGPVEEGGNGFYRPTERGLTGGDGRCEFLFAGLRTNPESIKSMEGLDGAWVEEANKASQRSLELLTPTIRKPNSEIWFSWNRHLTKDPVDKMFLGGTPPPRSVVRKVGWQDNPWFPDVLMEEMLWDKSRDRDKWLHVWEGEPIIHSEARVFQNWTVEDIDDRVPEEAWLTPRIGADWGFSVDPAVCVVCYVFGRTLYIRREVRKVRCEVDETPSLFAGADWQDPPRWENPHGHPGLPELRAGHRIVADSSRPETISYMRNRGFNILPSKKGAGSVEEGVEFVKSYDIVVHPDCVHAQDELTFYSYKTDPLTDEVLPVLEDRHNHFIDAIRYAVESLRRALRRRVGTAAPETVPISES